MKPTHFTIPIEIYETNLLVSVDAKDEEFIKYAEHEGWLREDYQQCLNLQSQDLGVTSLVTPSRLIIRLKLYKEDKYAKLNLISHEVFHAVTILLYDKGMKLHINVSDEAFSYLLGHIVEEICKKLKL